jgi:hypothetical protein
MNKNKMIQLLHEVEKMKRETACDEKKFLQKIMRSDAYLTVKEAIVIN